MNDHIEIDSGNVFADLGLPESDELLYKAELLMRLKQLLKSRGLTQKAAAVLCGTDQATLSKVFRGRIDLVSTDRLFRWLTALNVDVRIVLTDRTALGPGHVLVC